MTENSLNYYPRNLKGNGKNPPNPNWPNNAYICVQFVLNYEEGGENTVLNGDTNSEIYLTETPGNKALENTRDISTESCFEYGSRSGVWRILDLFDKYGYKITIYAIARAIELYPEMAVEFDKRGHEIACHHYRWINYLSVDENTERSHINKCIEIFKNVFNGDETKIPKGWYTGRHSLIGRKLIIEEYKKNKLELVYDADAYNDDLPYYVDVKTQSGVENFLVIPYTLDNNDMKFCITAGFNNPNAFFDYLKSAFDTLYEEGKNGKPKMMSIGLHCRVIGKPGRFQGLVKFVDYINSKSNVWVARRIDIANHWKKQI